MKMMGLRRVEAHSSQKELRLGSLAANPVRAQECATCGEPGDMSRTSTGAFKGLWFCRRYSSDWSANVSSVEEQERTSQPRREEDARSKMTERVQCSGIHTTGDHWCCACVVAKPLRSM